MEEKSKAQNIALKKAGVFARAIKITKEHYAAAAAISTLLYSVLCLIYSSTFFAEFGINFFSFGNLSDIYKTLLSGQIGGLIIIAASLIYIIVGTSLIILNQEPSDTLEDGKYWFEYRFIKIERIQIDIAIFSVLALITNFIFSECYDDAKTSAIYLKNGFSERYELKTSNETLSCRTIIGSTSDYVFTFNHEENTPEAIPKSQINKIKMIIVHAPPLSIIRDRRASDSAFLHANQKLIIEQKKWSSEIQQKCNQKVIWPANKITP